MAAGRIPSIICMTIAAHCEQDRVAKDDDDCYNCYDYHNDDDDDEQRPHLFESERERRTRWARINRLIDFVVVVVLIDKQVHLFKWLLMVSNDDSAYVFTSTFAFMAVFTFVRTLRWPVAVVVGRISGMF